MSELRRQLLGYADHMTQLRRTFHEHPERGLEEYWTAGAIESELDELGIEHRRVGATGVLGTIRGANEGPTVALRADIDGLPVQELNDVPYRSLNDGVMHACGHDSHIAALLGAAWALMSRRQDFAGEIRLIFQPAEEIGRGAEDFVAAGVLSDAVRVLGLHAASDLPTGTIGISRGVSLAAVDLFDIDIQGKGAHVSRPHLGADALYVASQIVVGLQAAVSRLSDPRVPYVVGIGTLSAGTTYNAVPETAHISGTTRTLSAEQRARARADVTRISKLCAEAYGARAEVTWTDITPAVVNPAELCAEVAESANRLGGIRVVTGESVSLGGDNFAELQEQVPGVYVYLGTGDPNRPETQNSHHNGNFDIDEAALPIGAALYAQYALDALAGVAR
ncbi:M20 family metallopeptidase [Actinobaculum sp. 352]|uniref:M20 metallopeptidase family protein n=1 Tax=Actinobaculum sp. 352 TaxID=2490946 RepID=UPI000F7F8E88|nr:M20 family metallopeptidase [Actinobaculum sp. 352]RTE50939.1 amidohydrolase [Actinobaculum sp. 352]